MRAESRLGKSDQISVQSNRTCTTALDAIVDALDARGVRYLGRKISRQAVVNALILGVAASPGDDWTEALDGSLVMLEDLALGRLDSDDDRVGWLNTRIRDHLRLKGEHAEIAPTKTQGPQSTTTLDVEVDDEKDEPTSPSVKKPKGRIKR